MHGTWPQHRLMGPRVVFVSRAPIFRQGDRIRSVDFIHAGVVKLLTLRDDHQIHLGVRTEGNLLGSVSAMRGETHLFSAVAMTDCSVTRIPTARFHELRTSDLSLAVSLHEMLASEIEHQLESRTALASGASRARLEQLCVDLVRATGKARPDGSFKAALTVAVTELARLVGTSREHVSRLLSVLEAEHAIHRDKGWLILPFASPLNKRVNDSKRLDLPL